MIRVLLADDHPSLRLGLRMLLEREHDIQVVSEAGNGREALKQIESLHPDVAILDCQLPVMDGVAVAMQIPAGPPPTRVLALSAYADERYVRGMMTAKAVGYLLKDEAPGVIVAAVRAAAEGKGWFSARVATQIASWTQGEQTERLGLTDQEIAILRLVTGGKMNKEIGLALGISEKTVEKHLGEVYAKLNVSSRVEAAVLAVRKGLA